MSTEIMTTNGINVPIAPGQAYSNPYLASKNSSLYVGDLHPSVTETALFKQFATVGQVVSVRIPRDPLTRQSLGYGYVNYQESKDARKALDLYQSYVFNGRACRLMWVQRDPSLRKSNVGNVIIKNLDKGVDSKKLHGVFSTYGSILSCKVVYDDDNKSKGYGFVHYETEKEAQECITNMNGKSLNGKTVTVEAFTKNRTPANQWTNCYIKQFPATWTEETLKEQFSPFGEITSLKMDSSRGKPFAFINYQTHEQALEATEVMNKKEVFYKDENGDEKPLELFVSECQSKRIREKENKEKALMKKRERIAKYQGCNVFIKNLDDNCTEDWLREHFSKFGTITSCKIATTENNTSLGHGYICFSSSDEANDAIKQTNRKQIPPWTKPFYVALHQPAEERRLALQRESFNMPRNPNLGGMMQMQQSYSPAYAIQPNPYLGMPPNMSQSFTRGMGPYPGIIPNQRGNPSALLRGYPFGNPAVGPYQQHLYGGREMGLGAPQYLGRGPNKPRQKGPKRPVNMGMQNNGMMPNTMHNLPTVDNNVISNANVLGNVPNTQVDQYSQQMGMNQQTTPEGPGIIDSSQLAQLPEEKQKLTLGEKLFPLVHNLNQEKAPKITGMILELDNAEILMLLEDSASLKDKVDEAVRVLDEYNNEK